MNLNRACSILGITNINDEDLKSVKKKYRSLMKRHHPDNNTGDTKAYDIGDAYNTVTEVLNKIGNISKQGRYEYSIKVINLENIVSAYTENNSEKIRYLALENDFILIDTMTLLDGIWSNNTDIIKYNIYGRYNVNIKLYTDNLDEKLIKIRVAGVEVDTVVVTAVKVIVVRINSSIEITYRINVIVNS